MNDEPTLEKSDVNPLGIDVSLLGISFTTSSTLAYENFLIRENLCSMFKIFGNEQLSSI